MSVTIHAACTGCDATAEGGQIQARYVSTFGGSIHHIERTPIEDAAPEGWVLFDPYTLTTYCPTCWALIVRPEHTPTTDGCLEATRD